MEAITISLTDDGTAITLKGGSIHGRDELFRAVTAWPGWKRTPVVTLLGDRYVSCYRARLHPSSVHFLLTAKNLKITWENGAQEAVSATRFRTSAKNLALNRHRNTLELMHGWPTARVPHPYQDSAVRAISESGGSILLADDMGLGKTSVALWAMWKMKIERLLIVCPATVKFNWKAEIEKTLGSCFCWIIDGTAKRRADMFAELQSAMESAGQRARFSKPGDLDLVAAIINYDLLRMLPENQVGILHDLCRDEGLICDESHYLKTLTSKRTKFIRGLCAQAQPRSRLLLSGTPIRNTVADVFAQVEIVQPGTWTSIWDFNKRYLIQASVTYGARKAHNKVVGTRNLSQLNEVMQTVQIRRKKEHVANLPLKVRTFPELELDEHTKKVYKAMKDYAIYELSQFDDDTPVFAASVQGAVQIALRCEQLCQGFVGGIPEPVMNAGISKILVSSRASKIKGRVGELLFPFSTKMSWLQETIKTLIDTGHAPVVFAKFNGPLFWLKEQYGDDAFLMHGGVPAAKRADMLGEFERGIGKLFLCQVKIAEGFNLLRSQDVIFLGRDWSPAINRQAEDRCHRIGTLGTVNIQVPIIRGTIETSIHKRLASKEAAAEKVLTIHDLIDSL